MEKYGTYRVFKDKDTGKIIRVPHDSPDMEKTAENSNLIELKEEPDE